MAEAEGTTTTPAPAAPAPPTGGLAGIPRETTPTWEMELLLSGATVFGLLGLPHQLDLLLFAGYSRFSDDVDALVMLTWAYAKSSLLILIATFILHLALRGFWIALVGLDSVYPGGIRWDRLRAGPHQRAAAEAGAPDMAARIERADNRASRVFGVGVGLALSILVPLGIVLLSLLGLFAARILGLAERTGLAIFFALFAGILGPFGLLVMVDRRFGARLRTGGWPARLLRGTFRFYDRIGFGRSSNPLLSLFQSHEGSRRTGFAMGAIGGLVVALVMVQFVTAQSGTDFGDFAGLPDDDPGALAVASPGHYASQRGSEPSLVPLPYLPDRVVKGPYVELFVPYDPRRLAPAVRKACGEAVAVADAGGPPRPALDCLRQVLALELDGEPVTVALEASADPVSGQRGLLAMIPAEGLAPGRHELSIRRPARPGRTGPEPKPWRIPFWR